MNTPFKGRGPTGEYIDKRALPKARGASPSISFPSLGGSPRLLKGAFGSRRGFGGARGAFPSISVPSLGGCPRLLKGKPCVCVGDDDDATYVKTFMHY
jgi:hypothetical protein